MSWPPRQPPRSEHPAEDQQAYDIVVARARGQRSMADPEKDAGYFGRLLTSPQFAARLSEMGRLMRSVGDQDDSFSHHDREFVDQVLSADFGTNIVQVMHVNDAISAGVRIEAIEALRACREELLSAEEKQLANFVRKVIAGAMDAPTWLAMEQRMGERGTVEYAIFILHLQLTMRLMATVGMPDPPDAEIDATIANIKSGQREVHSYRRHIGW